MSHVQDYHVKFSLQCLWRQLPFGMWRYT